MKQWRYLEDLELQVDSGQILTQQMTAKRVGCSAAIVSMWNQDPRFVRVAARIIRLHNDPLLELGVRQVLRRLIQTGSPKHLEAVARMRGMWDLMPEGPVGSTGTAGQACAAAGAVAVAQVNFYGLPAPPTPAEVTARNPPIGSNLIVPAPPLPPAGGSHG